MCFLHACAERKQDLTGVHSGRVHSQLCIRWTLNVVQICAMVYARQQSIHCRHANLCARGSSGVSCRTAVYSPAEHMHTGVYTGFRAPVTPFSIFNFCFWLTFFPTSWPRFCTTAAQLRQHPRCQYCRCGNSHLHVATRLVCCHNHDHM